MTSPSTLTLPAPPQESLNALVKAVAQRLNWRIMTGGTNELPRFLIEKPVRYDLIRGWRMTALYQITGSFQQAPGGETMLRYGVSGQVGVPFIHAVVIIGVLSAITFLLAMVVFDPLVAGNWIGYALLGVMLLSIIGYGYFAYRSYQGHLRELHRFMEAFAQSQSRLS